MNTQRLGLGGVREGSCRAPAGTPALTRRAAGLRGDLGGIRGAGAGSRVALRAKNKLFLSEVKTVAKTKAVAQPESSPGDRKVLPAPAFLRKLGDSIAERVDADPDFLFKLIWEITQDQVIIVFTLLQTCGLPMFWSPQQLASAILLHVTALFNDAVLVYFLAPVKSTGESAAGRPKLSHVFETGDHLGGEVTMEDRARCLLAKFWLYARMGTATAVLAEILISLAMGRSLAMAQLARVAAIGFIHLGVSANARYQMVNGADMMFYRLMSKQNARVATTGLRICNQLVGGKLFLALSSLIL